MGSERHHEELSNRYLSAGESVEKVSSGDTRTFVVTDLRVLDIQSGQTAGGQSIEEVQSTLYTDVAGVDLRIAESFTETDTIRRIIAGIIGLVGLLLLLFAGIANAGQMSGIIGIVGIILLGMAAWLWFTATETTPGGIRIQFRYPTEGSHDRYLLPESQQGTARSVVKMVGLAHESRPD